MNMDTEQEVKLELTNKTIKRAWIAGIIVGTCQIILGFLINPWYFLDAAIFYGTSFGVYVRNRVLSVAMLLYCFTNVLYKAYEIREGAGLATSLGIILFLILCWFVFQGMCGVFAYHKITTPEAKPKNEQEE